MAHGVFLDQTDSTGATQAQQDQVLSLNIQSSTQNSQNNFPEDEVCEDAEGEENSKNNEIKNKRKRK